MSYPIQPLNSTNLNKLELIFIAEGYPTVRKISIFLEMVIFLNIQMKIEELSEVVVMQNEKKFFY